MAAAGTGAVVAFGMSGSAQGAVEIDIPEATHSGEDGTVEEIGVEITGSYQYQTNDADTILLSLMAASESGKSDWGVIDQQEDDALAASSSGQYELDGSLLSHDQIEAADFSADPSETNTTEIPVEVVMDVMNNGEAVVTSTGTTTVVVEVTSTAVAVSAEISGSGQVEIAV